MENAEIRNHIRTVGKDHGGMTEIFISTETVRATFADGQCIEYFGNPEDAQLADLQITGETPPPVTED